MPVPKYEDKEVAALDQQFAAIVQQAGELAAHSEARMKELEAELKSVQSEKVRSLPLLAFSRTLPSGLYMVSQGILRRLVAVDCSGTSDICKQNYTYAFLWRSHCLQRRNVCNVGKTSCLGRHLDA